MKQVLAWSLIAVVALTAAPVRGADEERAPLKIIPPQKLSIPADIRTPAAPGSPRFNAANAALLKLSLSPGDKDLRAKLSSRIVPVPATSAQMKITRLFMPHRDAQRSAKARLLTRISAKPAFLVAGKQIHPNNVAAALVKAHGPLTVPHTAPATQAPNQKPIAVAIATATPSAQVYAAIAALVSGPPTIASVEINAGSSTSLAAGDQVYITGTGLGGYQSNSLLSAATAHLDLGTCGGIDLAVTAVDPQGTWMIAAVPDLAASVDRALKPGLLTVSNAGGTSAPRPAVYAAAIDAIEAVSYFYPMKFDPTLNPAYALGVLDYKAHYDTCGLLLTPANYAMGCSGTDTLGASAKLVNGWQYTGAQAVAQDGVELNRPPPPPNSIGAAVLSAPNGVTLNTSVTWFSEPGYNTVYGVHFQLQGPTGTRAVSTQPATAAACGN